MPGACSGYFAAVVRAWDRTTGAQVALKIMARSVFRDHLALLGREVAVMHAMGTHAHLLPLQQVMYAEQRLYLVTGEGAPPACPLRLSLWLRRQPCLQAWVLCGCLAWLGRCSLCSFLNAWNCIRMVFLSLLLSHCALQMDDPFDST